MRFFLCPQDLYESLMIPCIWISPLACSFAIKSLSTSLPCSGRAPASWNSGKGEQNGSEGSTAATQRWDQDITPCPWAMLLEHLSSRVRCRAALPPLLRYSAHPRDAQRGRIWYASARPFGHTSPNIRSILTMETKTFLNLAPADLEWHQGCVTEMHVTRMVAQKLAVGFLAASI